MMRTLARQGATEFESEAQGLPLSAIGLLAICFEDMSDNEFSGIDDSGAWEEFDFIPRREN